MCLLRRCFAFAADDGSPAASGQFVARAGAVGAQKPLSHLRQLHPRFVLHRCAAICAVSATWHQVYSHSVLAP